MAVAHPLPKTSMDRTQTERQDTGGPKMQGGNPYG